MSPTAAFLADNPLVVLGCTGIVVYVSKPLRPLLIELCGTAERANFWLAFSNVALILVPLIFALEYTPESGSGRSIVFEMAAQLKYGLVGFVLTLSFQALMLFRFIPTNKPDRVANPSR